MKAEIVKQQKKIVPKKKVEPKKNAVEKLAKSESIATKSGEKNAFNQLTKFDKHFSGEDTNIRLDSATSNKDGTVRKRYIVSQNGKDKYEAKFEEKDKKQKLVQVVSLKHVTKK